MGNRTPQNQSRINTDDETNVRYWAEKWGVSAHEIVAAVERVGPATDEVAGEIGEQLYFSGSAPRNSRDSANDR